MILGISSKDPKSFWSFSGTSVFVTQVKNEHETESSISSNSSESSDSSSDEILLSDWSDLHGLFTSFVEAFAFSFVVQSAVVGGTGVADLTVLF